MTQIRNVHHINFLFHDLDAAVARFSALGLGPFRYEALPARGVSTARVKVGETWIVLVSPTDPDSVPGRALSERGEGFFLLSFGVDDLDAALEQLNETRDVVAGPARPGLQNWRVADVDAGLDLKLHLTEDPLGLGS